MGGVTPPGPTGHFTCLNVGSIGTPPMNVKIRLDDEPPIIANPAPKCPVLLPRRHDPTVAAPPQVRAISSAPMAQLLGSACTPSWSPGRGYAERTLVKLHPIRLFRLRVPVAAGVESPGHLCVPVAAGAENPAGEVISGEIDIDRGSLIDGSIDR